MSESDTIHKQEKILNSSIPILSFFTGAGFLDMGFEKAGFDIIWTNEPNLAFINMYEFGYTAWRKSEGINTSAKIDERRPIELLHSNELLNHIFTNRIPNIWGIIGGPPCPDFSNGGKHKGFEGENGQLSRIYIELIIEMQPPFFLMENVSGICRIKKHKNLLDELVLRLKKNGYFTDLKILNALQFDVPQDRPRMFLIGVNEKQMKIIYSGKELPNKPGWFPFPLGRSLEKNSIDWPTKNKFGADICLPLNIPLHLTVQPLLASDPSPEELPNGKEYFQPHSNKFYEVEEGDTTRKSFKRLHRYRFSPTACYGNNEVHLHPWKPRRLSVREVLRIQGIPDTYILPEGGSLSDKFKLIGNGVPMPLAFQMAKALKSFLLSNVDDH